MTAPTIVGFDPNRIRECLTSTGFAYIEGLSSAFDYPGEFACLGSLVPQYGGALVRDIQPDPAVSNDVVSSANTAELTPHTEWYEFPGLPPRYVALWGVRPAEGAGGETTLADGYALLEHFNAGEREQLILNTRQWRSRPTLAREGVDEVAYHPILEMYKGTLLLRFSSLDMVADDNLARKWVSTGRDFFKTTKATIKIERGAVLIWDNWRMLHARNAFADRRRHLRRVLIDKP